MNSVESRRAGRDKELRTKLKNVLDRFEAVFNKPLSVDVLHEFLDESEKHNRIQFLKDRIGVLSDQDVSFLRNVLSENSGTHETELVVADEIEELTEDDLM